MHTPPALYFLHWKFLTPFISLQRTEQTQISPFITTLMLSLFLSNVQDGLSTIPEFLCSASFCFSPTHRTDCRRGGCMVGTRCVGVSRWSYLAPEASDGKVLCGHKPQSKPHLSEPGTHQRTWRVMGRPARQKAQTLSMPRRNDRTRHDHAAAPLADCPFVPPSIHPSHPHKKRAPRSKHPGTLPKLKYPIIINRYQLSPTITQHAAETSESPSHWKPSRSPLQDSSASLQSSHIHAEYKQYHQQP